MKDYNLSDGAKLNLLLKPVISNGVLPSDNGSLSPSAKFDKQLKEHLFNYYNEEQVNLIVKKFHQVRFWSLFSCPVNIVVMSVDPRGEDQDDELQRSGTIITALVS